MGSCGCTCCRTGTEHRCPECGAAGIQVKSVTVKNMVLPSKVSWVTEETYFLCPSPTCKVVYFSLTSQFYFGKEDIRVAVWLKDQGLDVPLCYCQKVTRRDILEALAGGCPPELKAVMEHTGAGRGGRCLTENPVGRCCHSILEEFIAGHAKDFKGRDSL